MRGTVKFFKDDKGYGFITPEGGGPDLFVHYTGIQSVERGRRTLFEGQAVEFDKAQGERGPVASNVTVVEGE